MAQPFSVRIVHDGVTPVLRRALALGRDPTPVLRAIGEQLKSITEGNFNTVGAAFRPAPWPPKRDGSPSILQKSGTLARSFQLRVTRTTAQVSATPVYAAVHQFGSAQWNEGMRPYKVIRRGPAPRTILRKGIPQRPFFPMDKAGLLTPPAARLLVRAGQASLARMASG